MIRFFHTLVSKNVRTIVQSVNSSVSRTTVTAQDCESKELNCESHQREDDKTRGDHFRTRQYSKWQSNCSNCQPPAWWIGTMVAAGIQVSKMASDMWKRHQESPHGKDGKLSPLTEILAPSSLKSVSYMRHASKAKRSFQVTEVSPGEKLGKNSGQEDRLASALFASDEETCDRLNKEGASLAEHGEWKKAVKCFKPAAELGFTPSQFNLGVFYHTVSPDLDRARHLYAKAAASGHKEAAYNLSIILIDQRLPEWESAMQRAAELGLKLAQEYLASHYFAKQSYAKSRSYYNQARVNGAEAQVCRYWIGRCYEAEGNYLLADLWYQQAAVGTNVIGVDATARSANLGLRCTAPILSQSSSFASLLEGHKHVHKKLSHEKNNLRGKPLFFVPSNVNLEFSDERANSRGFDQTGPFALPSTVSRPETMHRSQSAVLG